MRDPVNFPDQANEEVNQFNLCAAYTQTISEKNSIEYGLSSQWEQLYNTISKRHGDHWAAALHTQAKLGRWTFQAEACRYAYSPENPAGVDDRTVLLGAFDKMPILLRPKATCWPSTQNMLCRWTGE